MDIKERIIVDYSKSIAELISAGDYKWTNPYITSKNFPTPANLVGKKIEISIKLFSLDNKTSEKSIEESRSAGYRPATIIELLAFEIELIKMRKDAPKEKDKKGEEKNERFDIVALGSVWCNSPKTSFVPSLSDDGKKPAIGFGNFNGRWRDGYSSLAVKI